MKEDLNYSEFAAAYDGLVMTRTEGEPSVGFMSLNVFRHIALEMPAPTPKHITDFLHETMDVEGSAVVMVGPAGIRLVEDLPESALELRQ